MTNFEAILFSISSIDTASTELINSDIVSNFISNITGNAFKPDQSNTIDEIVDIIYTILLSEEKEISKSTIKKSIIDMVDMKFRLLYLENLN